MKALSFPLLMITILLAGCASTQYIYEPDVLQETLAARLSPEELLEIEIPFLATPEMVDFARHAVRNEKNHVKKSVRLVKAIISHWTLDVTYDREADYSASTIFHETKQANCLSFTHLFVSLARSVGIQACYIDVHHDDLYSGSNMIVSSRHICAGVHDGADFFLIDFDYRPERSYRIYQKIDDFEAIANHYNNIAINHFNQNRSTLQEAIAMVETALRIKPDFSRALNNRGSLLHIAGRYEEAEQSYRLALQYDPDMPEANSNLAGMLLERGDMQNAVAYARQAVKNRPDNVQYHSRLAMALLHSGDYSAANKEFRWVVRCDPEDIRALHGLALTAYHLGNMDLANQTVAKGLKLQPDNREFGYLKLLIAMQQPKK